MTDAKSKYGPSFNLPPFTVCKEDKEYEVRRYQKAFWVSTTSSGARKYLSFNALPSCSVEKVFIGDVP